MDLKGREWGEGHAVFAPSSPPLPSIRKSLAYDKCRADQESAGDHLCDLVAGKPQDTDVVAVATSRYFVDHFALALTSTFEVWLG
jgi:hypothetical protein